MKNRIFLGSALQCVLVCSTIVIVALGFLGGSTKDNSVVVSSKPTTFQQQTTPKVTYVLDSELDKSREKLIAYTENESKGYLKLHNPIQYWNASESGFDFLTSIALHITPPTILTNQIICIELNKMELFQKTSFAFNMEQVVFFTSDGQTHIPYWVQDDGKKDALIWMKIPELYPADENTVFLCINKSMKYPSVSSFYTYSNFDSVFYPTSECVGDYSFLINVLRDSKKVRDHSGYGNNGELSELQFGVLNGFGGIYGYSHIFFNNWDDKKHPTYFSLPLQADSLSTFTRKGSIEMWIDYKSGFLNEIDRSTDDFKHIQICATENGSLELYYYKDSFYFVPNADNPEAFVRIPWEAKNNDKFGVEFNIALSWDFDTKTVSCYLYGQKQEIDVSLLVENWKDIADSNMLFVGGNAPPAKNFFAAQIKGLYLYNSTLVDEDMFYLYQSHCPSNIYSQCEVSNQYSHSLTKVPSFDTLPTTDTVNYITHYSAPYPEIYSWGSGNKTENVFTFSNKRDGSCGIFGIPGHFYSYTGTPVHAKRPCYIEYVGLQINDPSLIDELSIDFRYTRFWKKYHDISSRDTCNNSFASFFQKAWYEVSQVLLPTAYSCGPSWHYRLYGRSILRPLRDAQAIASLGPDNTDTLWYRLEKPIYIDDEVDLMQIKYQTTNQSGYLKIAFTGMVCRDMNGSLSKCQYDPNYKYERYSYLEPKWNQQTKTYDYYKNEERVSLAPIYQAFIANEEKGLIELAVNDTTNTVGLVFTNLGSDTIHCNNDTVEFILHETFLKPWMNFLCVSPDGKLVYSIDARKVLSGMKGKEIYPNNSLWIPLIHWPKLREQAGFSNIPSFSIQIQVSEEDSENKNYTFSDEPLPKVIFWSFQNNSFRAKDIHYEFTVSDNQKTIKLADS